MTKGIVAALLVAASVYPVPEAHAQTGTRGQTASAERPLTLAERQAAWSTYRTEYQRRLRQEGQANADRWLDARALAMRGGTSPAVQTQPQTRSQPSARSRAAKDCKKVRWVNRAAPGFGGNPMTMRRVAVCDD